MNVWMINEAVSNEFVESILRPEYLSKAVFMIVLDLSKVRRFFIHQARRDS